MCHEVYQVLKKICTIGKLADYKETVLNNCFGFIMASSEENDKVNDNFDSTFSFSDSERLN
jgi:hypothetical protein